MKSVILHITIIGTCMNDCTIHISHTYLNLYEGRGSVVLLADVLPGHHGERDVRGVQPLLGLARRLEALVQDVRRAPHNLQ